MRDEFGADTAAAAAAILDHHRLAQCLADQIAGYASDNVGISSGCKRHNQMNGAVRIGGQSALRLQSKNWRGPERGDKYATWNPHRGSPNLQLISSTSWRRLGFIIVP